MNINVLFFILLAFFMSFTLFISWLHHQYMPSSTGIESGKIQIRYEDTVADKLSSFEDTEPSAILEAHLSCEKFGGPSDDEKAQQMVYWSDIPKDAQFVSPYKKSDTPQYLVFEPDGGGWNNIRMAMETIVVFAHSMGRTLVMPPAQRIYLLGKEPQKQKIHFSFADFFHLDLLDKEHVGLDIISMEEYLTREAGNFRDKESGQVSFPPGNRTNWDGENPEALKLWLRSVIYTPKWNPDACLFIFPSRENTNITNIKEVHKSLRFFSRDRNYMTPVNASLRDRMAETLMGRDLCIYDQPLQEERSLHFMCSHKDRVRFLVHFYAFIFFEDWKQQMWVNRFVRDHLRYIDELQCAAAKIVDAVAKRARDRNPSSNGKFDSFHIRRGDFQYEDMIVDASVLYESCMDIIPPNSTIYVSTDERDRSYFQPFADHYDLVYLDDFLPLIKGLNTNYYGMLDQLIASKGRYFFGTYFSTFTGYINRMRGYYVTKYKLDGYQDGTMQSYYFRPPVMKEIMRKYQAIEQPLFSREFPTAWRDIDRGIMEL